MGGTPAWGRLPNDLGPIGLGPFWPGTFRVWGVLRLSVMRVQMPTRLALLFPTPIPPRSDNKSFGHRGCRRGGWLAWGHKAWGHPSAWGFPFRGNPFRSTDSGQAGLKSEAGCTAGRKGMPGALLGAGAHW